MKTCQWCGAGFESPYTRQIYCNQKCAEARDAQKRRERYKRRPPKKHEPRICRYCGDEFTPTHGHQRYCVDKPCYDMAQKSRCYLNGRPKKRWNGQRTSPVPVPKVWTKETWRQYSKEYYHRVTKPRLAAERKRKKKPPPKILQPIHLQQLPPEKIPMMIDKYLRRR